MKIKEICSRCGHLHGTKPPVSPPWYHGKCDVCKIAQHVTDAKRFGVAEIEDGAGE